MTSKTFGNLQKFAFGHEMHLATSRVSVQEIDGVCTLNGGSTLHMMTFHCCSDELRLQICQLLEADTTFLSKNSDGRND